MSATGGAAATANAAPAPSVAIDAVDEEENYRGHDMSGKTPKLEGVRIAAAAAAAAACVCSCVLGRGGVARRLTDARRWRALVHHFTAAHRVC